MHQIHNFIIKLFVPHHSGKNFLKLFKGSNSLLLIICLLAAGSFLLTLNLPLVGEEGVYTNAALDMIFNKQYKFATPCGNIYPRPPLYNWFIILASNIFTPKNIVLSARFITMITTIVTAWCTFIVAKNLFPLINHQESSSKQAEKFALFTAAIFLSGDLLFKHGWLAYSDPIFAMFVFAGMALLLLATIHNRLDWVFGANVCIFLGFLCKVPTAYLFYILTLLVLLFAKNKPYTRFLLNTKTIILHILFIIPPVAWSMYAKETNYLSAFSSVIKDLLGVTNNNPESHLWRNIMVFPLDTWLALLPSSLVVVFAIKHLIKKPATIIEHKIIKILIWIIFLNFIPYWITSQSNLRYLMPIYPLFSIVMAYLIWRANLVKISTVLLLIAVIVKYLLAILWFPYEYSVVYGNAELVAKDILHIASGKNLYINADTSAGYRVSGAINHVKWPAQPLQRAIPPTQGTAYYFVIHATEQPSTYMVERQLIKIYKLKNDKVLLYQERSKKL